MSTVQASIEGLITEFGKNLLNIINAREDRIREILGEGTAAPDLYSSPVRRGRPPKVAWTEGVGPEPVKAAKGRKGKGGRLPRRSQEDIESMANDIVAFVARKPDGFRAEAIRAALKIDKREWMRPLQAALDSKKLKKSGEKRATVYTVSNGASGGATSGGKAKKKAAKKTAKKAKPSGRHMPKAKAKHVRKASAKTSVKRAAPKKVAPTEKHVAEKPNSASSSVSEATA